MKQRLWETESKEASKIVKQQLKKRKAALNEKFLCVCVCVWKIVIIATSAKSAQ